MHTFIKVELGIAPPRGYTYAWEGEEEIKRDDYVIVPPNSYSPYPSVGRVLRTMERVDFTGVVTILSQKVSTEVKQREVRQGDRYPDPGDDILGFTDNADVEPDFRDEGHAQ